MILICPVVDGHERTKQMLDSLASSVSEPDKLKVVIYDNASNEPYKEKYDYPFGVHIYPDAVNRGYYVPLNEIAQLPFEDDLVGLLHNDLVIYQPGWDKLLREAFEADPKLGLVGFCGSNEVDENGGRGAGTMVNFRGAEGYQSPAAGLHIDGLRPALVLDSLFMMFRKEAIKDLEINDQVTLAHFYDRIWPVRLVEKGCHVAVAGIECDHAGGITTMGNQRYADDCERWLRERNIPFTNPETEMYLVAERAFLGEYRDNKHFFPCKVGDNYEVTR